MAEYKEMVCEDGVCATPQDKMTDGLDENSRESSGALIYFGDPMCSWCWGIAKDLEKLKEEFAGKLDFEMIMGGLRPGGGDLWDEEMKAFLREHWEHVEEASGQPFNYGLLEKEEFEYDTEPPARAVRVMRDLKTEMELEFYNSIQHAFYVRNEDPGKTDFYRPLCDHVGVSFESFKALFESPGYKQLVRQDFQFAQKLGVRGFPSVVLQQGAKFTAISMGYSTFDNMKKRVEELLVQSQ